METLQVDNGLSVWHALSGSKVSNTPFEARLVASENETSHAVDCILDFRETGLLPMLELQKKTNCSCEASTNRPQRGRKVNGFKHYPFLFIDGSGDV